MPGYMKLDPASVDAMSSSLSARGEAILAELSQLAPKADPGDMFIGASSTAYVGAYQRWDKAQKEASAALKELSRGLKVCVENWTDIDNRGATAFDQFYG